ncbi:MAG TPA: anaerobic ribonucleoside-triphosphate reductase activating protein [Spirochaetia bacterium]|nr:anaerobic ribonucleoside-triphosphate reductase activating protein [Spirochaetia bacterium]
MQIGGIHRFSLIDYPAKTACVVFTQGCNLRCPYCHNPELIRPDARAHRLLTGPIFDFLEERKGKLDAVVITGGEPTLQPDLPDFIREIIRRGYLVKLDTNGTNPVLLEKLLADNLLSYVALDIKAPLDRYAPFAPDGLEETVGKAVGKSVALVRGSGTAHEFRTTMVRKLLSPADVTLIAEYIQGASRYVLQRFVASHTYDPAFLTAEPFSDEKLTELAEICQSFGIQEVLIR